MKNIKDYQKLRNKYDNLQVEHNNLKNKYEICKNESLEEKKHGLKYRRLRPILKY
mgnify:CR=1 FL=1